MKRKLFVTEFRRAFGRQIMIVATVFVVLLPVSYFLPSAIEAFSTLLLILLVGSGGILGGVAFHKVFQDKRLPLLQVLPISRSAAWAMLVSANAAATVPSYFLIVLLAGTSDTAWPAGVLLMIYFEAFCCGCCAVGGYTPEFGGRFFVDLAMEFPPGIIVSGALAAPWILGLYLGTPTETYPLVVGLHVVEFFEFVDMRFLVGGSLVCALGALGVAHDYFQFGESALQSTQWRNAWRAAIVSAGFVVLAVATVASGLTSVGDEWLQAEVWVSADGQYLAVLEEASRHPKKTRISVRSISDPAQTRQLRMDGVREVWWTADSNLRVLSRSTLIPPVGYIVTESDRIETFSPTLEPIGSVEDTQIVLVERKGLVPEVAVVINGGSMTFATLSDTGAMDWSARYPVPLVFERLGFGLILQRVGKLQLLRLRIGEESMVWALNSQLKELEQSTTEPSARLVVDDVVYGDSESVVSRLRDMLPVPPEAAGERVGMYLTSIWPATILFRPFDWFFPFGQAFESGPAGTSSITYATEDLPPFYVISDPRTGDRRRLRSRSRPARVADDRGGHAFGSRGTAVYFQRRHRRSAPLRTRADCA